MFRKKGRINPAPKPITVEQILSDLETFSIPKSEVESTRHISPNDPNFDSEWWKLFQTFVADVDKLKSFQHSLDDTKDQLTRRRRELRDVITKLEGDMETQKREIDEIECTGTGS